MTIFLALLFSQSGKGKPNYHYQNNNTTTTCHQHFILQKIK